MNNFNYRVAPHAYVYVETKVSFGLNPPCGICHCSDSWKRTRFIQFSPASFQLLKNSIKSSPYRPKITLHVSHPECNADSTSRRVPFCGKWPPQAFSVHSYFWRNGKIFHSATRREVTLQKKLFFSQPLWILWSWQRQCGLDGNTVGHLSKHLHKSVIYLCSLSSSWSVQSDKRNKSVCCVLWTHSSWHDG